MKITKERLDDLDRSSVAEEMACNENWAEEFYELIRLARRGLEFEAKEPWIIEDGIAVKYKDRYFLKLSKWATEHAIPIAKMVKEYGAHPTIYELNDEALHALPKTEQSRPPESS